MPKMRSHSGTKKRFKVSGTGKIMRGRPGSSHLAPGKTQKRIRHLRKESTVALSDVRRSRQQLANIQ